jgi:hypothetical protein
MLSIKLFSSVFCLFQFNQNIQTLCFGIEPKQSKLTVSKTNQNKRKQIETTLNFLKKYQKYALYHTVSVALLFVLVQSKHRNSLFRYRTEITKTNVLFRIVPILALIPIKTSFELHPSRDLKEHRGPVCVPRPRFTIKD